jgi:hypothetical protein
MISLPAAALNLAIPHGLPQSLLTHEYGEQPYGDMIAALTGKQSSVGAYRKSKVGSFVTHIQLFPMQAGCHS